jgi:signal peptidase I
MENHILYRNNLKLLDGIETKSSKYLVIPKGYVFVLGDNKNHSTDSRYFGPISTKEVKGKLLFSIKI